MTEHDLTWEYVYHWAASRPDAEAIVFGSDRVSYRRFADIVNATALALLDAGVGPGDRVALVAMARPEFFYTFMAANQVGAMWLGISPKFSLQEMRYIIGDCQPTVLIAVREYYDRDLGPDLETIARECPSLRKVLVIGEPPAGCERYDEFVAAPRAHLAERLAERAARVRPDDNALLMYTSGSTGKPKGVVQTHRSILCNVAVQIGHLGMDHDMRVLMHFPINHVAAAVEIGYASIFTGGASVMMDRFDPAESLQAIERERVTVVGQVPAMFLLQFGQPTFPQTDFSSVRVFAWGGSTAPKLVIDVLASVAERHGAKLKTGYGATEMCGFVTFSGADDSIEQLMQTAGRCVPPFEMKVVDDERREVPRGHIGEIAVRGPITLKEYWNKPEQTAAVLDAEGWYYSGDLGYLDDNDYVRISSRKSEMFKTGGENVFPREIEDVLEQHPEVLMAAVIGV
ncbi:MAG: long-chain fatty acid--CoA ligase, partial [Candidatus Hydrogenedentes bacterium]|nr:long-chain fatty acid--CoA ligase [Candidatus Hydrogenedentota bacterium]